MYAPNYAGTSILFLSHGQIYAWLTRPCRERFVIDSLCPNIQLINGQTYACNFQKSGGEAFPIPAYAQIVTWLNAKCSGAKEINSWKRWGGSKFYIFPGWYNKEIVLGRPIDQVQHLGCTGKSNRCMQLRFWDFLCSVQCLPAAESKWFRL